MRFLSAVVGAFALFLSATGAAGGFMPSPPAIERPDGIGDQVIYYYDARDGFTTFITVRNTSATERTVAVMFFSGGFSVPFEQEVTLAAGELRVLDVGSFRALGLAPQPGVAMAFAVNVAGSPIVTRALNGNFTVANLATNSAWGAAAAARSALEIPILMGAGTEGAGEMPDGGVAGMAYIVPTLGTVIDGSNVFLQPIQPAQLDLAAYYNPNDLAPVADGGNQLIFVSFSDLAGATYVATPTATSWSVRAVRNNGTLITETTYGLSGVAVTDLASVAGSGVNGASGSIQFQAPVVSGVTRMIFFAEALGTFGTGYLLPPPTKPYEPLL